VITLLSAIWEKGLLILGATSTPPQPASTKQPFPWAVGFLFGNTELSLELWNIISGISGFDD
jgi:hypothetical protein